MRGPSREPEIAQPDAATASGNYSVSGFNVSPATAAGERRRAHPPPRSIPCSTTRPSRCRCSAPTPAAREVSSEQCKGERETGSREKWNGDWERRAHRRVHPHGVIPSKDRQVRGRDLADAWTEFSTRRGTPLTPGKIPRRRLPATTRDDTVWGRGAGARADHPSLRFGTSLSAPTCAPGKIHFPGLLTSRVYLPCLAQFWLPRWWGGRTD